MKILVTGATGLVGSHLIPQLEKKGHQIRKLVRNEPSAENEFFWDPEETVDLSSLRELDAVVHLAGESISEGRWTPEKKAKIRDSRVKGTKLLCESLAELSDPPKVLVCASAIGYYGNRGDQILTEDAVAGTGFLSEVCQEWEAAAEPARQKGIRVVHARFGIILSSKGGAVKKMLPPFKFGLGGKVGPGSQYFSWIAIDDASSAIEQALNLDSLQGPINLVAPNPVSNLEFTKALGHVLHRPTIFAIPSPAARIAFGEMADALLLSSSRVHPQKLLNSNYEFLYPELEGALYHVIV
jgi:uncharacterized protein (TIGR01777 family)